MVSSVIDSADVVVVGSGAFGASVAYHLAQRGARVVVLERAALASQTSPRAAGLSSQVRATPALTRLAQRAVAKLAAFTDGDGAAAALHPERRAKIARTERDAEQLAREVARGDTVGVDIDFVSVAEARRRLPILGERGIRRRHVEPDRLQRRAVGASDRLLPRGGEARGHAAAAHAGHRLRDRPARRRGRADAGRHHRDAGGGGCGRRVGARGGRELGGLRCRSCPRATSSSSPSRCRASAPAVPIARVIDANVYVRHEQGGLMLGGYEPNPRQFDMAALPPAFQIAELPLDIEVLRGLAAACAISSRSSGPSSASRPPGGMPTMSTDDRYIVGPVPGVRALGDGGCCVGGLSVSPSLGEAMAQWMSTGAELDLSEVSTRALRRPRPRRGRATRAVPHAYATHYRASSGPAAWLDRPPRFRCRTRPRCARWPPRPCDRRDRNSARPVSTAVRGRPVNAFSSPSVRTPNPPASAAACMRSAAT